MNAFSFFLVLSMLVSATARAETTGKISVHGMHCSSCEKAVQKAVCNDSEVQTWLSSCSAKTLDPAKQEGELNFTLKPGTTWDQSKEQKLTKLISATGRETKPAQISEKRSSPAKKN